MHPVSEDMHAASREVAHSVERSCWEPASTDTGGAWVGFAVLSAVTFAAERRWPEAAPTPASVKRRPSVPAVGESFLSLSVA